MALPRRGPGGRFISEGNNVENTVTGSFRPQNSLVNSQARTASTLRNVEQLAQIRPSAIASAETTEVPIRPKQAGRDRFYQTHQSTETILKLTTVTTLLKSILAEEFPGRKFLISDNTKVAFMFALEMYLIWILQDAKQIKDIAGRQTLKAEDVRHVIGMREDLEIICRGKI